MLRNFRFGIVFGVLAAGWSSHAWAAYNYSASISYSTATQTLEGFHRTWKDDWQEDYYYDCLQWNPEFYGCDVIQIQINSVMTEAQGISTAPQILGESAGVFYVNAILGLDDAPVPFSRTNVSPSYWYRGTWTSTATHYSVATVFIQYCPYQFCTPPMLIGSWGFVLGSTVQVTPVCVHAEYVLDFAAIAVANGWPTEPWERAVTMLCGNTGVVTYIHFSDSFGTFYGNSTNDPCRSQTLSGLGLHNRAGDLHSHPRFTNTVEYNRGNGCLGDQSPKTQQQLDALNLLNEGFSGADALSGVGRSYLKTPTGRVVKAGENITMFAPEQVYP